MKPDEPASRPEGISLAVALGVLDEADTVADQLREASNVHIETERSRLDLAVASLGAKTINAMRAIRALLPILADDQLAIIGRAQVETTIDLWYLRTDTTRVLGKKKQRTVRLTSALKTELFLTHGAIHFDRVLGRTSEAVAPFIATAMELRRSVGLPERSHMWHCAATTVLLDELEAESGQQDDFSAIRFIYRQLSSYVHSSLHLQAYFRWTKPGEPDGGSRGGYHELMIAASTLDAAIEALRIWSAHLDGLEASRLDNLANGLAVRVQQHAH